jgi:2'-5' RNA ligase
MAMLAVTLSPDISRLFQEFDLDIERDPSNHITMFYLGDNLPMAKVLKIIPIIYDITKDLKPFTASVASFECFPSQDLYPVIAKVKSTDLMKLRAKIKNAFVDKKVKFDNKFPEYQPHITLGYSENKIKNTKFPKTEFAISQISLYAGDNADSKLFINFPLTINKTSALSYYTDSFFKQASK